jgi:two-component system sensor histidine kinase CreC
LILTVCFAYPAVILFDRIRIVYLESAEEPLVDTANVLAELLGREAELRGALDVEPLHEAFVRVNARTLSARIYAITKEHVDLDVYVTDAEGMVLFDSRGVAEPGEDYSGWRDVSLTLSSGGRATRPRSCATRRSRRARSPRRAGARRGRR